MISALVLAAGQSKRMGRPKMSLPWADTTVLGRVIEVCKTAGVPDVLIVTGADRAAVEDIATRAGARTVFNPAFADQEMLGSLQIGLRAMTAETEAIVMALGDQPQIQESTVRSILERYQREHPALIVPSYRMRRGHPWLLARPLWSGILEMRAPLTARDFLRAHERDITYVDVETPTVLMDLDTPQDYRSATDG
ncbi:MAG: nucleotidyltransferase family protein [Anaerolineae bacterium]